MLYNLIFLKILCTRYTIFLCSSHVSKYNMKFAQEQRQFDKQNNRHLKISFLNLINLSLKLLIQILTKYHIIKHHFIIATQRMKKISNTTNHSTIIAKIIINRHLSSTYDETLTRCVRKLCLLQFKQYY